MLNVWYGEQDGLLQQYYLPQDPESYTRHQQALLQQYYHYRQSLQPGSLEVSQPLAASGESSVPHPVMGKVLVGFPKGFWRNAELKEKLIIILGSIYVVWPVDALDFILTIFGLADDAAVAIFVIATIRGVNKRRKELEWSWKNGQLPPPSPDRRPKPKKR